MNCNEVLALLNASIDEELLLCEKQSINSHLVQCANCQNELSHMQALQTAFKKFSNEAKKVRFFAVPESLNMKIHDLLTIKTDYVKFMVASSNYRVINQGGNK